MDKVTEGIVSSVAPVHTVGFVLNGQEDRGLSLPLLERCRVRSDAEMTTETETETETENTPVAGWAGCCV